MPLLLLSVLRSAAAPDKRVLRKIHNIISNLRTRELQNINWLSTRRPISTLDGAFCNRHRVVARLLEAVFPARVRFLSLASNRVSLFRLKCNNVELNILSHERKGWIAIERFVGLLENYFLIEYWWSVSLFVKSSVPALMHL